MIVYYSDHYSFPLPAGHHFPIEKYRLLRQSLLSLGIIKSDEFRETHPAIREMITLAHTEQYYDNVYTGTIEQKLFSRVGLPWSFGLINRALASVSGSICAADDALKNGIAGNLGGGTHHAFSDHGQGFCVFNDLAVTILSLLVQQKIHKTAIIDLDAHQGNGNAAILGHRPEVFIFSMHGARTYPSHKVSSTLDIGLDENIDDGKYLLLLQKNLPKVFSFKPDIIFYIGGTDPLQEDRFGKLGLSMAGLAERDYMVLSECRRQNIPLTLVMGGGYANPIEHSVLAHVQTYQIANKLYG